MNTEQQQWHMDRRSRQIMDRKRDAVVSPAAKRRMSMVYRQKEFLERRERNREELRHQSSIVFLLCLSP